MDSPTRPTFSVSPGGLKDLTPSQTEKAKYFFRVNLDLENKGFVTWEDVEFYILFHMTVTGREDDAQLEALLNQRTKEVWDVILNNWPDGDKGRVTLDQFLDTWASLAKYIESEQKLPQWLEDWVTAGFKLYDVKGDGRLRPGVFHALYSKMGLRIISSTAAYHALMDAVNGPLTLEAVLTLTKRLITCNDPTDLSGFLMPGFEVKLNSGPSEPLLRPSFGAETVGKTTIINASSPETEEATVRPPKQEAKAAQANIHSSKFPSRSNNPTEVLNVSNAPRSKVSLQQPAAEMKSGGSKPIPVFSRVTGRRHASGSTTSPNAQQSSGHSMGSEETSRQAKPIHGTQDAKQSARRGAADKNDRGLICKILRDMNINPSECEILIDENNLDVRPAELYQAQTGLSMKTGAADNRWRPVVQMTNGQVRDQGPRTQQARPSQPMMHTQRPGFANQYMFQQQFNPANVHIRHRLPGPRYPLSGSYNFGIPSRGPYSSIPSSLENISRLANTEYRANGFNRFRGGPNFQQTTNMVSPQRQRQMVDDAFVDEVVRKAAPLIQHMVREEVRKYVALPDQRHTFASTGGASGTAKAGGFKDRGHLHTRGENKKADASRAGGRPAFPKQPDEYEFNGSVRRANADASEGFSTVSGGSRATKRQDAPASSTKTRSGPGSPIATTVSPEERSSDDFWRGQSGQSPSVNKMVFDRLLKRQQEMRAAQKPAQSGNGVNDAAGDGDKSEADAQFDFSKKAAGDEGSDNTLEDEMLFIPGLGAYPPFVSMGVDASFLQGSPMGGMGFAAPPFMMAMGGPMFSAQPGEFGPDMENTPPGMDGVFIVIDEKPESARDATPSTAGNAKP